MTWLLDTSILIFMMKFKSQAIVERIAAVGENDTVGISFVTYAELLKGAEGSNRTGTVLAALRDLSREIPVEYTVDEKLCRLYGDHANRLKRAGTPIGGNELWIACHALSIDATLVTNNTREFSRIDGLRLENWAEQA
ncbi:MAG: PIN domain-containing protein [Alkalispirochaeta sp.]